MEVVFCIFRKVKGKGIILLCYLLLFAGSRLCNGRGSVWAAVRCCWLFWGCLHRPALLFPAAQSLGQRGALCSGPLRSPCGRRRAGLLPQSRRLRHLGCGCRLFLLDIVESELCIRLGLRQLPAQAVRRRSRLCPECRRGPRIHLRLHGRRLHQFITLFTEFPFCLTSHTGDDYSFSQVFCILPTLLVLLAGLVVKVGRS